jgi:hypothetical protein
MDLVLLDVMPLFILSFPLLSFPLTTQPETPNIPYIILCRVVLDLLRDALHVNRTSLIWALARLTISPLRLHHHAV